MQTKRAGGAAGADQLAVAQGNRILAMLSGGELHRLLSSAEMVDLTLGQVLYEPGELKRYVYFPTAGYISQISSLSGAPRIEVGLFGPEGMVGSSLFFGIRVAPWYTVVQGAGCALRLDAFRFVRELARGPVLLAVMNRYMYVRVTQLAQMTACARFHTVQERLARWLLMTRDRARSDTFHVTHDYMASMLGVRRVGVTEAATWLQEHSLIRYSRGELTIINGCGLEAASCECYATAKRVYRQHMNQPLSAVRERI